MKDKPKLLHIITGLNTGGAERALCNVLTAGLAEQFECGVLSLSDEGTMGQNIRELGVDVYPLGMNKGIPSPFTIARLTRAVNTFNPDLLQGWMYHGNLAATFSSFLTPTKSSVVWNIRHSLYALSNERPMTRQVIRANRLFSGHPHAIIYNSQISKSQHESLGYEADNSTVIPNGFDTERLKPSQETRKQVRKELSIPLASTVIGHVARYHPMKGHRSFLNAATSIARTNSSVRFLLVGRSVSPDNRALFEIVPEELKSQFIFTGERSDAQRLFQGMDFLATSSAWGEAFPNVLGEAMATGLPCVATDVGDSAQIIGNTGLVAPPSDTEALTQKLLEMLQCTDQQRQNLGQAARKRVTELFDIKSITEQYSELYRSII